MRCETQLSVPVITLILLICLALPARGWEILAANEKEYISKDVPKDIPGKGTDTSTLTITDSGLISDLNVKLSITHPFDPDMDVFLVAPDGTQVELFTDVGGSGNNFVNTILDDEAMESIADGSAPFTGSYRPEGHLADMYGKDVGGTWLLETTDDASSSRAGTLNAWSLIVTTEISEPLPPPVIQARASAPDGILDTVSWTDIGETRQYDNDTAQAIPDQGTLLSELVIENAGAIQDLNVKLNISHALDSDLDVFLVAPDGQTEIELFTDVGASGDNFVDTILDDEAPTSITAGSAPFTGSYRPEGTLADLIGQDICGTWTLKVTDDSWLTSGTLNSWSLIVDIADVAYFAECASNVDFSNVVSDSGWTTNRSHTFTGLDKDQEYWYHAKARPLETWLQTSQNQFETNVLTDTQATDGDVTLSGAGGDDGLGPELNVIANPGFESLEGWFGGRTNPGIFIGSIRNLWSSEGIWAGFVGFSSDHLYLSTDLGFLVQSVDLTGVDTLIFDWASWGVSELLEAAIFVGDTLVWYNHDARDRTPSSITMAYNEQIDVSAFDGVQDLAFVAYSTVTTQFDAAILWDNLRTYGSSSYVPSGRIVSTTIGIGGADTWDVLSFDATKPNGTVLTVDILPAEGTNAIPGYEHLASGSDLSDLSERTIRLRANLSTTKPDVTPVLHHWSVTYMNAARESGWSNVVSSSPQAK